VVRRFQETADPAWFAEIFARYRKKVYFACRGFYSDGGASEDATQETFLRAYEKMGQFSGGDFGGWLMRIAKNICIDQWRKRRHETEIAGRNLARAGLRVLPWFQRMIYAFRRREFGKRCSRCR